jgi:hypothetical protein
MAIRLQTLYLLVLLATSLAALPCHAAGATSSQFEYDFTAQRLGAFQPQFLSPAGYFQANPQNGRIVTDPDVPRNKALEVLFPQGLVGPGGGSGIQVSVPLAPADRYWFSYRVRFSADFVWRSGGKLPGLLGGDDATGGLPADGDGWSVRQMWFGGGKFAPYLYHMDQAGTYGDTLGGTESFGQAARLQTGQWRHVAGYVQLNTDGANDGRYMLYLDGVLLKERNDLRFRTEGRAPIDKFTLVTFFGGQSDDYRPVKDEYLYLDNIRVSQNANFAFETLAGGAPASALTVHSGDFNHDGVVNVADYTAWRDGLGQAFTLGDYAIWKANFGNVYFTGVGSGLSGAHAVPEPSAGVAGVVVAGAVGSLARRSQKASVRSRVGCGPAGCGALRQGDKKVAVKLQAGAEKD